jgi:hypothetical protein
VSDAASPLANLNPSRSEGPIECRDKPSEALQQLGPVYQTFNTLEKKRLTSEVISRIESHQLINLRSLYDVGTSLCNVCGMCSGNPLPRIITRRNHNPGRAKKYFLCPADGPPPSKRKGSPQAKATKYIRVTFRRERSNFVSALATAHVVAIEARPRRMRQTKIFSTWRCCGGGANVG